MSREETRTTHEQQRHIETIRKRRTKMQLKTKKDEMRRNATTRHYYSMPTIITTINGSRIGCPSYHYANSRYLLEIRRKRTK